MVSVDVEIARNKLVKAGGERENENERMHVQVFKSLMKEEGLGGSEQKLGVSFPISWCCGTRGL